MVYGYSFLLHAACLQRPNGDSRGRRDSEVEQDLFFELTILASPVFKLLKQRIVTLAQFRWRIGFARVAGQRDLSHC